MRFSRRTVIQLSLGIRRKNLSFFFLFKADPYLIVSLGKKKYDEQDNFKPNTLNPVFGK